MNENGTCFFHSNMISLEDQTDQMMSVRYVRKNGQRLKGIVESRSSGKVNQKISFCILFQAARHLDQGHYTWWGNSALSFMAQTLQSIMSAKVVANLPGYLSPCTITGAADNILYIIELTVDFETNLNNNARCKELKYRPFLLIFANDYKQVKFINLSISSLGIFGNSFDSFAILGMERGINNGDLIFIIS